LSMWSGGDFFAAYKRKNTTDYIDNAPIDIMEKGD